MKDFHRTAFVLLRKCVDLFAALDPEQKALQDGRIGSEVVVVDPTSQCGNMRIEKERIEVVSLISLLKW